MHPHSPMQMFVDRLDRRSGLTTEEADALLGLRGHFTKARANEDIVSPGETTIYASLVVDGLAGRFGQVVNGQRQITGFYLSGDMCDLHSLVAPTANWAVQALSTTTILKISHLELRAVANAYPRIAQAFWRDCSVDASVTSQWVVNVGRRDASSRLAHLLCEMGVRHEDAGSGIRTSYRLPATQAQLGDALGLTSVHVNRTVRMLRDLGLAIVGKQQVTVGDWDGLARRGDFDVGYLQIGKVGDADPVKPLRAEALC